MESHVKVLDSMRKDIEEKLNSRLSSILKNNDTSDDITNKLDVEKLQEEVYQKYNHISSSETRISENDDVWASINFIDSDSYDKLAQNLNSDKSSSTRLRSLDNLLNTYVIDTKQKSWIPLAKNLQQCLLSVDDHIFHKSLKVHYRLITTPSSCSAGYLNLIHATITLFNTDVFQNTVFINENDKLHRRTISMFKLIIRTQKIVVRNWSHANQKVIEEILITFIYMLNYFMGNECSLGAIDFLAMLDTEARWFQIFCYGLYTRNIIFECLKKTNNLVKFFITTCLRYCDSSPERNHRQFLNFSHAVSYLEHYLLYPQNPPVFPVKLEIFPESVTLEDFLCLIIDSINTFCESPNKQILITLLQSLLGKYAYLILNPDIQQKLLQPFLINTDKSQLSVIVQKNHHILQVMNKLSESAQFKMILWKLITGRKSAKRLKQKRLYNDLSISPFTSNSEKNNILQVIVNITVAIIRSFITKSETKLYVPNIIFELLKCCENLLKLYPHSLVLVNLSRLETALRDFYKVISNYQTDNFYYKSVISKSLCFFIEHDDNAIRSLKSEIIFLHEIICDALMPAISSCESKPYTKLILSIANHNDGIDIIKENHDMLLKQFFINIWTAEHNESETAANVETYINQLLQFIYTICYSFNTVKALLSYENEGTVTENQEQPVVLGEIIENCLAIDAVDNIDTILGVTIIRILVTNVDVLMFLQEHYNVHENLLKQTSNDPVNQDNGYEEETVIDQFTLLRYNILKSIKHVGINKILAGESVSDCQRTPLTSFSNFTYRRNHKVSEFQKFIYDVKDGLHDYNWILQARRVLRLSSREKHKMSAIYNLFLQMSKLAENSDIMWPSVNTAVELFPEEYYGVTLIVRFGIQQGLLQPSFRNEGNLIILLKQSRAFLNYSPETFVGFDWFVAVVFLICSGNLEKCRNSIENITDVPTLSLIWYTYGNSTKQNTYDHFCRQVEVVLENTGRINCALQVLGTSARHIVKSWLSHCFFTTLDFNEICNFILMALLYPPEYIVFFVVAVFEHIKSDILTLTHDSSTTAILKAIEVMDFHIADYFGFMDKLSKQHRHLFDKLFK